MNLTKLFNFKYLKENIKKSKAIILLCIFLVPIINSIMYLMRIVDKHLYIPDIMDILGFPLFGMYIIPVVLSFCLFGFIYKRKSSDFVLSMPISRKQIFMTNTLGGIIIIFLTNFINLLFLLVITVLSKNIMIDYMMFLHVFLICFISYIFVFVSCNVALSLSGNRITTIVTLLLILFLIPYIHTFTYSEAFKHNEINKIVCDSKECAPVNFECGTSLECKNNVKKGIYTDFISRTDNMAYNVPYAIIKSYLFSADEVDYGMNISLIKMTVISILEILAGLFLFGRRKSEIIDTSFRSETIHLIVRDLTLIPIVSICYLIIREGNYLNRGDILVIVFMVVLVMTYMIIYDLLTRKRVTNILRAFANLVIVGIIVFLVGESTSGGENIINIKDIEKIRISEGNSVIESGNTSNRDIINFVSSIALDNKLDEDGKNFYRVIIYTNKGTFNFNIALGKKNEDKLQKMLEEDGDYLNSSKNRIKRKFFGVTSGFALIEDEDLANDIIEDYKKNGVSIEEFNASTNVSLYYYDNYVVNEIRHSVINNYSLNERLFNYYNESLKEYLDTIKDGKYNIWSYSFDYKDSREYQVYMSDYSFNVIKDFVIEHVDEKVDISLDYVYVSLHTDGRTYYFITNRVDEFNDVVKNNSISKDTDNTEGVYDEEYSY